MVFPTKYQVNDGDMHSLGWVADESSRTCHVDVRSFSKVRTYHDMQCSVSMFRRSGVSMTVWYRTNHRRSCRHQFEFDQDDCPYSYTYGVIKSRSS